MKTLSVIFALLFAVTTMEANPGDSTTDIPLTITENASYNLSPFCFAVAKGDVATVKKLIDLGADVNAKSRGMTPLMFAARYNHCDIINVLLENGADADIKDSRMKFTALKYAELSNAQKAVAILKKA